MHKKMRLNIFITPEYIQAIRRFGKAAYLTGFHAADVAAGRVETESRSRIPLKNFYPRGFAQQNPREDLETLHSDTSSGILYIQQPANP